MCVWSYKCTRSCSHQLCNSITLHFPWCVAYTVQRAHTSHPHWHEHTDMFPSLDLWGSYGDKLSYRTRVWTQTLHQSNLTEAKTQRNTCMSLYLNKKKSTLNDPQVPDVQVIKHGIHCMLPRYDKFTLHTFPDLMSSQVDEACRNPTAPPNAKKCSISLLNFAAFSIPPSSVQLRTVYMLVLPACCRKIKVLWMYLPLIWNSLPPSWPGVILQKWFVVIGHNIVALLRR